MTTNRYSVSSETRDGVEIFILSEGGRARAEVAPGLGNNCFSFGAGGESVLEPIPFADFLRKPTSYGIPILFPFPNRIRDGRFTFQGRQYEINPPRHGFVRDRAWGVEGHGASDAEGAWLTSSFNADTYADEILSQFPFPFRLEVTYRVREGGLEMLTVARNTGGQEMPLGFGIHPYFRKPARGTVTVPANQRWELSGSLPTGRLLEVDGDYDLRGARNLEGLQLDDIFTDVGREADGLARCYVEDEERGLCTVVEFSAAEFPHVVVYTPPAPREAVCVEPNTCPTDAFNLRERGVEGNVIVLGPGASASFNVRVYTQRR